jgi:hypothetical protein
VAIRWIQSWQSAVLKKCNRNSKVAISRIKQWQSAEFKGGNQPNETVAISRIQRCDKNSNGAVTQGMNTNKTTSGESRRKRTEGSHTGY